MPLSPVPTRRIGLLGGSFDPPHLGHAALARAALDHLRLDELRWLPAGQPWQKGALAATPAQRQAMVALQLAELADPRQHLDPRELLRPGPSYTLDTLRELAAEQPGAELWLVLGADQARNFPRWHEPAAILARAGLAVARRALPDGAEAPAAAAAASEAVPEDSPFEPSWPAALRAAARRVALPMAEHPAAATAIRAALAAGQPAAGGALPLAPAVAAYIDSHRLYRVI